MGITTIKFGFSASDLKRHKEVPVVWDPDFLINAHLAIAGDSGTGKTHQLRTFIRSVIESSDVAPRFHIFDVHGDIAIPGASEIMFSASSPYGFNPLQIDADPHFGGVNKCIQNFIVTLNRTVHRRLGPKQEAVLRSLLLDVFERAGFDPNNSVTWTTGNAPANLDPTRVYLDSSYQDREEIKRVGKLAGIRWDPDPAIKCWWVDRNNYSGEITRWQPKSWGKSNPTLSSVVAYAKQQLRATFLGTGERALELLEDVNRKQSAFLGKMKAARRDHGSDYQNDKADEDLGKAKTKLIEVFSEYVDSISTGREIDDIFKYDSVDVLKSVVEILENLEACGIFRNQLPPFAQNAPVWRYNIKALSEDEQILFINFRMRQLFTEARMRGETPYLKEVAIVDEAKRFVHTDSDHPLNIVAREARKFGLALWLASQSPTHFPEDVYAALGTKVVLGIDRTYWKIAESKYGITQESLAWITAQKTMLVHMKRKGETAPSWSWVVLEKDAVASAPQQLESA